jgi:hypothetical protein
LADTIAHQLVSVYELAEDRMEPDQASRVYLVILREAIRQAERLVKDLNR